MKTPSESLKEKIEDLRQEAYHRAVALSASSHILLQEGRFATEEDFDRELEELLSKWNAEGCYEF